jgi:hypothetical protein
MLILLSEFATLLRESDAQSFVEDAECCTHVRTRFSPQEGRPMRKAHNPFHGKRRYGAHAEVWLDSNLFVTLPGGLQCAGPVAWLPASCVGLRAPLDR